MLGHREWRLLLGVQVMYMLAQTVVGGRTTVTFDYGFRFMLGDPTNAQPKLEVASNDTTFTKNITGMNCTQLAWSQLGRMSAMDCLGACSATPGCRIFQYSDKSWSFPQASISRGCFIHDGTQGNNPQCTPSEICQSQGACYQGLARDVVPPPIQNRTGVDWAAPGFDDSSWMTVDLPHDFILNGTYVPWADGHHGYLPRDRAGWYRKKFTLKADGKGSTTWIHFEGVFQVAEVFLNGQFMTRHTSGYLGFDVDLCEKGTAPHCAAVYSATSQNVLSIRVDASFGSGHWYEGGGIERKSYLISVPSRTRFSTDGIFAQSRVAIINKDYAELWPTVEVEGDDTSSTTVSWQLQDPKSNIVATSIQLGSEATSINSRKILFEGTKLQVEHPSLWSIRSPELYTLTVTLSDSNHATIDDMTVPIGIRSINWTSSNGFTLNENNIHIRGFSHHSDFGAVGGAVADRIDLFRAQALRSVGGNTWRTSHNPYHPALYDILDTVGVVVWDENRDFNQLNTKDMENLVRRDRNHPSVVIWSACNEVECYVEGDANITGKLMQEATKKWDITRPFSANLNQVNQPSIANDTLDSLGKFLDVEGFSHGTINSLGAAAIHHTLPDRPVISSECCSCQSQRGEDYENETVGLTYPHTFEQASCMQRCMNYSYPWWHTPSPTLNGNIAGTLGVWTLFDYGGEPGPWPLVSSSFGQFDIAGFAKSASYWYRSLWLATADSSDPGRPPLPQAHIVRISQSWLAPPKAEAPYIPPNCDFTKLQQICPGTVDASSAQLQKCLTCMKNHANIWKGNLSCDGPQFWHTHCTGQDPYFPNTTGCLDIQVFTDLPTIELFLNGISKGRQGGLSAATFANFRSIKYEAGNLTAVGYDKDGTAQTSHTVLSPGTATALRLTVDVPSIMTGTGSALLLDGHDTGLIRVEVIDLKGNVVPDASNVITFSVLSGPGRIAGVHNGDAKSHEAQVSSSRSAYHGLARAAVKVTVDAVSNTKLLDTVSSGSNGDGITSVRIMHADNAMNIVGNEIVVSASAAGLRSAQISIPVSTDPALDAPLVAAAKLVPEPSAFN